MAGSARLARLRDPHTLEVVGLLLIVLLAMGLRTYRLPELLILHNDQGRDALVVMRMLLTGQPVLEGPIASVGTFHRGPAYYYLLAPAYALTLGHPIGGALLSVALDLAALLMLALLARSIAGPVAALSAAGLWAVAPILVDFGRFQWNPQAMPFFVLLALYAALRIARGHERWLMLLVPSVLVAWQIHDPALFFVPLLAGVVIRRRRSFTRDTWVGTLVLGVAVLLPFLIQQLTHGLRDVIAMATFVAGIFLGGGREPAVASSVDRLVETWRGLQRVLPGPAELHAVLIVVAAVGVTWAVARLVRARSPAAALVLGIAATPLLYAFWPAPFHSHYLVAIYWVPLLLAALGVAAIVRVRPEMLAPVAALAVGALVVTAGASELSTQAGQAPAPIRWDNRIAIAREVVADAAPSPFAFVLHSTFEPRDGWRTPWQYAFHYAGVSPDPIRVDLPTYAVFDPAGWNDGATYGGHVRDDVRWVRFSAPDSGACVAPNEWEFTRSDAGSGIGTTAEPLRLAGAWPWSVIDGRSIVEVDSEQTYMLSFEYRAELLTAAVPNGGVFAFAQLLDASGQAIGTLPGGGGLFVGASNDWRRASLMVDVPADVGQLRLIMRGRGMGTTSVRDVCVAEVIEDDIPR